MRLRQQGTLNTRHTKELMRSYSLHAFHLDVIHPLMWNALSTLGWHRCAYGGTRRCSGGHQCPSRRHRHIPAQVPRQVGFGTCFGVFTLGMHYFCACMRNFCVQSSRRWAANRRQTSITPEIPVQTSLPAMQPWTEWAVQPGCVAGPHARWCGDSCSSCPGVQMHTCVCLCVFVCVCVLASTLFHHRQSSPCCCGISIFVGCL